MSNYKEELLGHKSITMTMRYAHHNTESLRCGVEVWIEVVTIRRKNG